jgi:putative transposase
LNVWAKKRVDDEWVHTPVWLSAALDEYSRSIAAFIVSQEQPNSWTIAHLLRRAIRPKSATGWFNRGIPDEIQIDNGKDFTSTAIRASCAALGVRIVLDPPYHPNSKGKVESWFKTLKKGPMTLLPGCRKLGKSDGSAIKRLPMLLTVEQITEKILGYVISEYHREKHSETGRTPEELWLESVGMPRLPESDDALHLLLMHEEMRIVHNVGIRFKNGTYWAPELADLVGKYVTIRSDPDDDESIYVYLMGTNSYVTEACIMGQPHSRFGVAEVQQAARDQRTLLSRFKARATAMEESGRLKPARQRIEASGSSSAPEAIADPEVEDLIQEMRRAMSKGETALVEVDA